MVWRSLSTDPEPRMGSDERLHALAVEVVCLMQGLHDGDPVRRRELDAAVAELAHELDGVGETVDAALLDDAAGILAAALAVCAEAGDAARPSSVMAA